MPRTEQRQPGSSQWPLVGRRVELERCLEAIDDGRHRAVVVHGPPGVGKTRLSAELLGRAESSGRACLRARASLAAATMPLGALVHLLPASVLDRDFDPVALFVDVAATLRTGYDGPVVLFVDDMQWLDVSSAALLGPLVDARVAFLVGTVRSGEPAEPAVESLWQRDDVMRVDLANLSADDIDALLHLALGGPAHAAAVSQLWETSGGNPLFVKELVLGAIAAGNLVEQRGVWWLTGPLVSTPRLADAVAGRIGQVGGAERAVLDLLAVCESAGLGELEATVGPVAVETLERAGLVAVHLDGRRQRVTLAHPLYGDVLRTQLPTLTRRRFLLEQAECIEQHGARRRGDPLRIATARLDGDGFADPDLLTTAARLARHGHDFAAVERLTRAGQTDDWSPEATLLRAEALHELGEYTDADELLARWHRSADVDFGRDHGFDVPLYAMHVRNLMWGLQRPEEALAVNRDAQQRVGDTAARDELITDEALTLMYSDRPSEALVALGRMSASPGPRARVLAAIAEIPALLATGRCETALRVSDIAYAEHRQLDDQVAIAHPGVHRVYRVQALADAGRLEEAEVLAEESYQRASRRGPPLGRDWFALGLGRAALLGGKGRTAMRWLAESAVLSGRTGYDGPRRLELSLLATAQAWLGELDAARSTLEELADLALSAYDRPLQQLGPAWVLVASGDPLHGREMLRVAAERAAVSDQRAAEAWLLHDIVRLDDAGSVAPRLTELAATSEGAVVPAYAVHARAAAAQDAAELDEASRRFEEIGMALLAAEAATAAAHVHQRRRAQRAATASLTRARLLADRCEGVHTPGLVTGNAPVPLTKREREVGTLAGSGFASREIAERLYLSVRTVDNHLQNIYTKLGVSGRAELAAALGLDRRDSEPGDVTVPRQRR